MAKSGKNRRGAARQRTTQARRDRDEALRAERARVEARDRLMRGGGIAISVVAVVVVVVVIGLLTMKHPKSGIPTTPAPAAVTQQVASIRPSVLAEIGSGTATSGPKIVHGQPVADSDGHPTVLYVGAEWCPFCAAERWPMIVALSRFGKFSGLGHTASSPSDSYPNTQTFSLHGATYTSDFLTLDAKEVFSNQVKGGNYVALDSLTKAEKAAFKRSGGYPYVNLAGRYTIGTQVDPKVLAGKTMEQIAAALSDPSTDIAKSVDGAANVFTASLCRLTNNQPASVCTAAPIPALASRVPG